MESKGDSLGFRSLWRYVLPGQQLKPYPPAAEKTCSTAGRPAPSSQAAGGAMQLCIPGGHRQPPARATWAKGEGLPAEAGAGSSTCAWGKRADPAEPTREMGSRLQSQIPSLGSLHLCFTPALQRPVTFCSSLRPPSPSNLPTHPCLTGTDLALRCVSDGDRSCPPTHA